MVPFAVKWKIGPVRLITIRKSTLYDEEPI